jgi:hypothetical protein
MTTYVPKDVQDGLEAARMAGLKKTSRVRVQVGDDLYPVLKLWKTGFAVEADTTPQLRGLVDLIEAGRHLYQCLIVASEAEGGEMRYEFKRNTRAADKAPLDFYRDPEAPIALLGDGSK